MCGDPRQLRERLGCYPPNGSAGCCCRRPAPISDGSTSSSRLGPIGVLNYNNSKLLTPAAGAPYLLPPATSRPTSTAFATSASTRRLTISCLGPMARTLYYSLVERLLIESGLQTSSSGIRRSTYCFRHTYATFRLTEGVDVYFLAKQMGTSVKMIEDYYGHITPAKNAERILQGIPGWEPIADGSGEPDDSVNADGAGTKPETTNQKVSVYLPDC